MLCPRCGHENPEDNRFCSRCGSSLEVRCPSCERVVDPGDAFCGRCGTPLAAEAALPVTAVPREKTPPDMPVSFVGGRYRVERFLGGGGKKKVYLAHDTVLDRDVAFSLIKTEGMGETSRERILREARAMGRLGSHPHIVTVFDLGEERGQPYMVAERFGADSAGLRLAEREAERAQLQARLQQLMAQQEARAAAISLEMVEDLLTQMHDALTDGDLQAKRALLSKVVARIDMGREGAKLSYTFPLSE